ncbi:MAG: tRNA (N6-isopentenyl adenosine(37)-C2)-methylthiotransferase MiaB [Desulfocapsaceae bacterium]|nr:tRNA (N6-isopentenyl adenosine(37)-C2)-methylthiotransferase MiaB [Desulfocapsaceae bacterium]
MTKKTFYIKTFGCQMNERDSEIMSQSLRLHGYDEARAMESADLVIINTCSIRAKAEQKVMSLLGMMRKEKLLRPELKICVAGCVAQQEGEQLLSRMPHVDFIVGTQNIYNILALLKKDKSNRRVVTSMSDTYAIPRFIPDASGSAPSAKDASSSLRPFKKFVTIMQGCNNFCTYCIVPYTRGREISRNKSDIIDEVKVLVDHGVKEITLLGQNVNSYAIANRVTQDGSPYSFPQLLREVAEIEGLKRLRFTTSHPKDLSEDLMRCFRDIDILCHQIHLPVQAGSDLILQEMNRKYTIEKYLQKVADLRAYCPDIAITTDMIVGFPGETDQDFEQTINLLEHVRYDGSFSFKYSDRPGTKSTELPQKVDEKIKAERLCRFQTLQNMISLEKNSAFVGKSLKIMVESRGEDGLQGRSEYNHVVHIDAKSSYIPGDIIDVFIVHAGEHSLQAREI